MQDLHMSNINKKNIQKDTYPFYFSGKKKLSFNDNKEIFINENPNLSDSLKNFSLNSSPMIKGKKVGLNQAIKEIKNLIKDSDEIHIDGINCDQLSIYDILNYAEKKRYSFNHSNWKEISNFYVNFQRFGGSFVTLNELKKRSDFILFIGWSNKFIQNFLSNYKWRKKNIFFTCFSKKLRRENILFFSKKNFESEINSLKFSFANNDSNFIERFSTITKFFKKSKYPVIVPNFLIDNYPFVSSCFDLVRSLNEIKATKMFSVLGSNNSAGFVNASVSKTGFPNAVSFTQIGPQYNPYEFNSRKFMKYLDLQIYFSNLDPNPKVDYFKKNIFIGHPGVKSKNKFDVFIPTKVPGIDSNGLILRHDMVSVLKLKKNLQSNYMTLKETLKAIE